ncbi:hypothetical protein R69888_05799 [Paraburkholderia haematera]|uniref:Uncharacterized protein n=1 Tax=Paraburkholderia haematera TaxID=2793077 RepID=A0ABM8SJE4_9BURK|nr:hypothetical protein R69888_05799 [Paraburkholderia haematera]
MPTADDGVMKHRVGARGVSDFLCARPMAPTTRNRSPWFPMQPRPRRTQCGVGTDDTFVTPAECARTQIPDAPLPPPSQGTRLRISGLSRFLLPTFLCGKQRKVGAPPHRGNANRPIRTQGKAKNPRSRKNPKPKTTRRSGPPHNLCSTASKKTRRHCLACRSPTMGKTQTGCLASLTFKATCH